MEITQVTDTGRKRYEILLFLWQAAGGRAGDHRGIAMPRDGISMEERNDEWGKGCVVDGKSCFDCGDCCDDEPYDDFMVCPDCQGTGRFWDMPCVKCEGMGRLD